MNTSESIGKIAAALVKAQREMTFAIKDSRNPAFKSTYADLSSVIEACKPALNAAGIAFIQMPAPSDPGTIALTTRLLHESGEWIESTATCPLQKTDPQGYGSANTYLRRYSLAAAVGLYQDDDDGNAAAKAAPQRAAAPTPKPAAAPSLDAIVTQIIADAKRDPAATAAKLAESADDRRNAIWAKLPADTQTALTDNWPGA